MLLYLYWQIIFNLISHFEWCLIKVIVEIATNNGLWYIKQIVHQLWNLFSCDLILIWSLFLDRIIKDCHYMRIVDILRIIKCFLSLRASKHLVLQSKSKRGLLDLPFPVLFGTYIYSLDGIFGNHMHRTEVALTGWAEVPPGRTVTPIKIYSYLL
jgi:hypothetical protein